MLCSIMLPAQDENPLRVIAAPRLPDCYANAINNLKTVPGEQSACAAAALTGQRVVVDDIRNYLGPHCGARQHRLRQCDWHRG